MQIPEMIQKLSSLDTPVVDRAVCERVFGIKRRRANELMRSLGGYRSGNTVLLDRLALIEHLRRMQVDPEVVWERRRKDTFADRLADLRQQSAARRITLPVSRGVEFRSDTLPAGVVLQCGRLTVNFTRTEELFAQLFALTQAAVNDFEAVRDLAESKPVAVQEHT